MATDSTTITKCKTNSSKTQIVDNDKLSEKNESSIPNMNGLERFLSNYGLKPINNSTPGYSKVASQIYKNAINKGFQLNLMIVGCRGLGKSSFLNTLFHTNFPETNKTSEVTESIHKLVENDVTLTLKIIEFPKFGDKINNTKSWQKISEYLDKCFKKQMNIDDKIDRTEEDKTDNLVHVCLYFIQPRSSRICLTDLDLELLMHIQNKVNIIPIIARADTMTSKELQTNKTNLMWELTENDINYFKFSVPDDSGWRPDSSFTSLPDKILIQRLIDRFPFAVVAGSETVLQEDKEILVRSYPWGMIEVDNLAYSDTSALRTLMLSTHLQELITNTHTTLYEHHRWTTIRNVCDIIGIDPDDECHPSIYLEKQVKNLHYLLNKKTEEMEFGFQDLVHKKQLSLMKRAKELDEMSETLSVELNQALYEFDNDFNRFIVEKTQWDCDNIDYHETYGTLRISRNGRLKTINRSE